MNIEWIKVKGILIKGHQVASGIAKNSPYSQGTIAMQTSFFKKRGIDLTHLFPGTLNVSLAPRLFKVEKPKYTFRKVKWNPEYPAEDFSFSGCEIIIRENIYSGWIYYPHPETKIGHFQDESIIEIIAPKIDNLNYGDRLDLKVNQQEISIV
jgi:CTP-dependent riboflavin kinase